MARAQPLTRRRVLETALAVVDREGVERLSMRRLARELGIEAMSLYTHVANKEDLLDGIVGLLAVKVEIPGEEVGDWADRLAELARRYRRLAALHPNAFLLIGLRPLNTPEALRPLEGALAFLKQSGVRTALALRALRVVASYANGYALAELTGMSLEGSAGGLLPDDLPPDSFPHLSKLRAQSPRSRDEDFEFGLRAVIQGLRHAAAARSTGRQRASNR